MFEIDQTLYCAAVALLAEGVDRNTRFAVCVNRLWVALLAEGVDRNSPNTIAW